MANPPDDFDEKIKKLFEKSWGELPELPEGEIPDETLERRSGRDLQEKEVKVVGVYEHPQGMFVLLRDSGGRNMPIWIGQPEAFAISIALEHAKPARPLTHDLIGHIIDKMGGQILAITVDDLYNETYYAKILVRLDGRELEIDSRPSDAIAVALRVSAPIYVAEKVLTEAKVDWTEEGTE